MITDQIISRPCDALTVHPLLKPLPSLAVDAPEMAAIIEGVELHGVLRHVVINDRDEIMDDDGRCIVLAARKAGLKEVSCIVRPDEDAASIILSALCGRRHLTKSALAYLAFPLMEAGRDARLRRRTENLKSDVSASKSRTDYFGTFGETVETLAEKLGFDKNRYYAARDLHSKFGERPDLRAEYEPRLLSGELSFEKIKQALAGRRAYDEGQFDLGTRSEHGRLAALYFRKTAVQFEFWGALDEDQKRRALDAAEEVAPEWPEEIQQAVARAIRSARKGGA